MNEIKNNFMEDLHNSEYSNQLDQTKKSRESFKLAGTMARDKNFSHQNLHEKKK